MTRPTSNPKLSADPAPLAETGADIQRKTRQQHAQERAQDYVEAIAGLIERTGEARATDLARLLGVTHVTVIRTVERLQGLGLVTTRPYRSIFLTDQGRDLAIQSRERHGIVVRFLEALGVSAQVAQTDAEGIEHHVSDETLKAFQDYLQNQRQRDQRDARPVNKDKDPLKSSS